VKSARQSKQAAQAEVDSAIAAFKKAKADLALAYVRSPITGQTLKIYARPGEIVGNRGIAAIGQTDQMFVAAQVYETDIDRVRVGQRATITSSAFANELKEVTKIGSQIQKNSILDTNPSADMDVRVVEVKIRLDPDDSLRVANLTNLQVEVVINALPVRLK
jgi:HlyD family secretion protein